MKRVHADLLTGGLLCLLLAAAAPASARQGDAFQGGARLAFPAALPPAPPPAEAPAGRPKPFDSSAWKALLSRYWTGGRIDYAAWRKDGTKELDAVLAAMSAHPYRAVFAKEARIAFLINVYNAFAIRQILGAYPVNSVKKISGFFDKATVPLDGGSYTLDRIESELIAPISPTEPRFRLALGRGAVGTPELNPTPLAGDSLLLQLERITLKFMRDPKLNRYRSEEPDTLFLSEVFQWYRRDFETGDFTLPRRLAPNFGLGDMMRLMNREPPIIWIPVDWRLNDVEPPAGGR